MKRILILILVTLIFSGCIREDQATTDPTLPSNRINGTSVTQIKKVTVNPTFPSNQQSVPEIKLTSFTCVYTMNNYNQTPSFLHSFTIPPERIVYYVRNCSYNLTEKYYAIYNLSITNNGLKTFNFTIYDMHLRIGNQIFNTTPVELIEADLSLKAPKPNPQFNLIAENASLSPGQNLTGCMIFKVNSSYDKSFQLIYNSTPIISESFKRNVEILTISEHFNYFTIFDIPQFKVDNKKNVDIIDLEPDDLYRQPYPLIWPNWVDRSTVKFYKELDYQNLLNCSVNFERADLPRTTIKYVLSVTPNKNITIMSGDRRLFIMDDRKKEIINKSMDYVAISGGQTYELYFENMPQMNISNAILVQTKFDNTYGWPLAMRMTFNDQIVVFDENQNLVIAAYDKNHFVS